MPIAYIYRGTFQVRSGETLRYREIAPDGVIAPEVSKTYAELAGIGSLSVPAVSLTPSVAAPSLSGVQIGAIEGVPVSLQPVVSPAAVSGVQVGNVTAAAVSLTPTVAVPSVAGVQVGSIAAASVSLQPVVSPAAVSGVQVGSINAAAVSLRPTVAVGSLTGASAEPPVTLDTFDSASGWTFGGTAGNANIAGGRADMGSTSSLENTTMTKTFSGVSAGKLRFDLQYTMIGYPSFVVHVNGVPTGIYTTPATWAVSPAIDCSGGNITVMFSLNDAEDTHSVIEIDNLRWSAT